MILLIGSLHSWYLETWTKAPKYIYPFPLPVIKKVTIGLISKFGKPWWTLSWIKTNPLRGFWGTFVQEFLRHHTNSPEIFIFLYFPLLEPNDPGQHYQLQGRPLFLNFFISTNCGSHIGFSPILMTKMPHLTVSLCSWYLITWV